MHTSWVAVAVRVGVRVGDGPVVLVGVGVRVRVGVGDGPVVGVREGVRVGVRVGEGPGVGVREGVRVGEGVKVGPWGTERVAPMEQVPQPGKSNVRLIWKNPQMPSGGWLL